MITIRTKTTLITSTLLISLNLIVSVLAQESIEETQVLRDHGTHVSDDPLSSYEMQNPLATPSSPQTMQPDVKTVSPEQGTVSYNSAEFSGLDKITGRIISFEVTVDQTVQFGALQVTPRICYAHPQSDANKASSFIEVDEITLDRKINRTFTGWIFSESPGLNAVEHPVYDVWLKGCKNSPKK
jgi:hypothetical protein